MRRKEGANKRKGISLYAVLWIAFVLFAALIILLSAATQTLLFGRRYCEDAADVLERAVADAREAENGGGLSEEEVSSIAYRYELTAYLVYDETRTTVACAGAERSYADLEWLSSSLHEDGTTGVVSFENELGYGLTVPSDTPCTLYFAFSLSTMETNRAGLQWASLVAAICSVLLAFAVSGLICMLIFRPVREVIERAESLARGDYSPRPPRRCFFSEIADLSDALEVAREEVSKADSMQKELIANVSHDFKTPLTMIKAYASMIKEISGNDKAKREAHAQIIIDEADRLSALVTDLLDLSRLEAVEERREIFDLSEAVEETSARFSYLKEKGYTIETEIAEGIKCFADRARIQQAVYNLISNAVNYAGDDQRVRVKLFEMEGGARLEIIDSGKGIPPEEVDHIWDRYYRSTGTHKRPVQGTGLGLSIVKSILLAHEIPFGVVSETGKGSCFWVEFPTPAEDKEETV